MNIESKPHNLEGVIKTQVQDLTSCNKDKIIKPEVRDPQPGFDEGVEPDDYSGFLTEVDY